jgi:hypothetical protein
MATDLPNVFLLLSRTCSMKAIKLVITLLNDLDTGCLATIASTDKTRTLFQRKWQHC